MPRIAALLLLASLFTVLVAARFQPGDLDRLTAVGDTLQRQLQPLLPDIERFQRLSGQWWHRWPRQPVEDLRHRLATDTRLLGVSVTIVEEGQTIRLRGTVPSEEIHQIIYNLAAHTVGIHTVVDELATLTPPEPAKTEDR
jgi:hypothetical protein